MKIKIILFLGIFIFIIQPIIAGELHKAAVNGDLIKIKKLISKGSKINEMGTEPGQKEKYPLGTPLHWAVKAEKEDAVKLLIELGANVNALTDEGTSLMVDTPLDYAVWQRNKKLVQILLKAGANVEGAGHDFHWPLMAAISIGDIEISQILLDHGADIKRKGIDGYDVLHQAVLKNQLRSLNYLFSKGIVIGDNLGSELLNLAIEFADVNLLELLIKHGAKINAFYAYDGNTPLHQAILKGNKEFVELLLAKGADVNVIDYNEGDSPLHVAIKEGKYDFVDLLLKKGAKTDIKNKLGKTPLMAAQEKGNQAIIDLLKNIKP